MTSEIEVVWVIKGKPADVDAPMWPATIFDLRSRRLRYQVVNKHLLFGLESINDAAKFSAVWCPNAGGNGRWQLIAQVADTCTEVRHAG